jgi:hypothetical protein
MTNMQALEQLTIPGTFSSWQKLAKIEVVDLPEGIDDHGFVSDRRTFIYDPEAARVYLAPNNAYHEDIYRWMAKNDIMWSDNNVHGFIEGNELQEYDINPQPLPEEAVSAIEGHIRRPLIHQYWRTPRPFGGPDIEHGDYDDNYYENSFAKDNEPWFTWYREAAFLNGGFVKNKIKLIGQDDRGESYAVPRNTVGEVLYSDDSDTIVIFNLKSGPLGAHLIRVEDSTDKFYAAQEPLLDRGPAPTRRSPNAAVN